MNLWESLKTQYLNQPGNLLQFGPYAVPFLEQSSQWPSISSFNDISKSVYPSSPWLFTQSIKQPSRAKSRGQNSLSGYIHLTAEQNTVPVRPESLHDFLNALSFLMFPQSKRAISKRHLMERPQGLLPGTNRTRTQDLLTVFDEGGVVRLIHPGTGALEDIVFGHAIIEHITQGKPIRAAKLDFEVQELQLLEATLEERLVYTDRWLAERILNPQYFCHSDEFGSVWMNQITPALL